MNIRIVNWNPARRSRTIEIFLKRPAFDAEAEKVAAELLLDIKTRGEPAVLAAISQYEGISLKASELRVSKAEFDDAESKVPEHIKRQIEEARARVAEFSRKSMRQDWTMKTPHGGTLGEFHSPLSRVGIYVPGGTAPLASTVIMTATLAQTAGVPEIVACTPTGKTKQLNAAMLYAMRVSGVTEAYRVGGIQAIGMMAYGIRRIEPVRKIVGPGGTFVTAAKRQVYGTVALDLVAGPSEIAILADDGANPEFISADLLSQAEHGTGFERAMFVTDSPDLAQEVAAALSRQIPKMTRRSFVKRVTDANGILLAVAPTIDDGLDLINRFAPEHFELMVRNPARLLPRITCAGAVFVGPWTPESVGDFAAGPSHVLPTGGAARMFSGLTVDDFRRRTSLVEYQEQDLRDALPIIDMFSDIEGLDGHYKSAALRFQTPR
ncbi:MAG: histidinol dehydrogenase [Kiritimatiellia bacterium]|jgi:histidinol dehydrogenase